MNHMRLWAAAGIITLIVVLGFMLSVPHTRDAALPLTPQAEAAVPSVMLRDSFKKGVHTITGSILMPNACATLAADAIMTGSASSTQAIVVEITTENDTGVCLQIPVAANFSVTIPAPASLPITATVNGSVASTSVL